MSDERAAFAEDLDLGAASSSGIPNPTRAQAEFGGMRERFLSDLQALAGHAQELLHLTGAVSGENVAHVREQLRQSLGTAGESIKRLQADAVQRGREMAMRTDSYVHDNPWQAIAVGAVAGVALGLAASSLMRSAGGSASTTRH